MFDHSEKKFPNLTQKKIQRARRLRQEMTLPEVLLWQRLRPKNNKDFRIRRQAPLLAGITVDFYYATLRIVFEIDGKIHELREREDSKRDRELRQAGFHVVRIAAQSVLANPDAIASFIRDICLERISISDMQ